MIIHLLGDPTNGISTNPGAVQALSGGFLFTKTVMRSDSGRLGEGKQPPHDSFTVVAIEDPESS